MNKTPPNILLILCDDLAYGDLSVHGNPRVSTPHIDRIANEGTRFTRHCSGPLCTPARTALFSGLHPYRTRAIDTYQGRSMLDPDVPVFPEKLADLGYRTGLFGKWHLGDCAPMRPVDRGFHESLVHTGGGLGQPANTGRGSYFHPDLIHNGDLISTSGYCADIFTDATIDFVSFALSSAPSFFACLSFNTPHSPLHVAEQWVRPHREAGVPETFARVYGMVENLDWNVGRVLQTLEENGRLDDTLVIFTSDHGPCPSSRHHGRIRWNAGLRDQKGSMYEGGIRVPFFWRWPGRVAEQATRDRLSVPMDLAPTLLELAGGTFEGDGRSLTSLLTDTATDWPDRWIPMQWHRGDVPERGRNIAVLGQTRKLVHSEKCETPELFNIEADPGEQHDLAESEPETVEQLMRIYHSWFDEMEQASPDPFAPPRIQLGTDAEPSTVLTRQDWRGYTGSEGWGFDNPGFWLVDIPKAFRAEVVIEFPNPEALPTLHVRCGPLRESIPLMSKKQKGCEAMTLDLPAGPHTFEAFLSSGEAPEAGVEFVRIHPGG